MTEKIDKDADLEEYIKTYGGRAGRTQKNEIPYKEYNMSMTAKSVLNPNPVFGVDLAALMERDREEVPVILRKCAEAVETYGRVKASHRALFVTLQHAKLQFSGLNTVGIYRVSGTNTQIQKLKNAFDRGKQKRQLVKKRFTTAPLLTNLLHMAIRLQKCESSC